MTGKKENAIDPGLFGALLRHERQEQGYSTAEEFAAAITEMTSYSVSKETIYKIESGKQEPKLSLFMAIKFLLYPDDKPSLGDPFDVALPSYWQRPIADYYHEDIEIDHDGNEYIDIPGIAQRKAEKAINAKKEEDQQARSSNGSPRLSKVALSSAISDAASSGYGLGAFPDLIAAAKASPGLVVPTSNAMMEAALSLGLGGKGQTSSKSPLQEVDASDEDLPF